MEEMSLQAVAEADEKVKIRKAMAAFMAERESLTARAQRMGKILLAAFNAIQDDEMLGRLGIAFSETNAAVGFMLGLAKVYGVSADQVERDAVAGQHAGQSLFSLFLLVRSVSERRGKSMPVSDSDAALAKFGAEMLLEAPELLEFCNEIKVVAHADVSACRWG